MLRKKLIILIINIKKMTKTETTSYTMREVTKYQFNSISFINIIKHELIFDVEEYFEKTENGSEEISLKFDDINEYNI